MKPVHLFAILTFCVITIAGAIAFTLWSKERDCARREDVYRCSMTFVSDAQKELLARDGILEAPKELD